MAQPDHNDNAHGHSHGHNANKKALLISFLLIISYMVVEIIGGLLTNSLALLSDAGHMLSDAAALGLSLLAFKIGEKQANHQKTFGYKRFEILAAALNGITLLVISIYIFVEAFHRFSDPPAVSSSMMIIAIIGLLVNILAAYILMKGDTSGNLNVKSAFLHVLGDMLGSVGAIVAGLFIWLYDWNIADPIASVIVAVLVLISGFRVVKDSYHILMQGSPYNLEQVKEKLLQVENIVEVHDLHAWSVTNEQSVFTSHLIVKDDSDRDQVLRDTLELLKEEFGINHPTIQVEGESSCISDTENCFAEHNEH